MITCKCPHCGGEINPASLLGQGKKKTMSEAALAARKANAAKPRPSRRKTAPDPTE